jgi:hypothetical protein
MTEPSIYDNAGTPPERWLHCCHYDICLKIAIERNWPSWCCGNCSGYEAIEFVQEHSDVLALLSLLGEVWMPMGKSRRVEP